MLGTGHHVPDQVVTNADLAARMNTSHEWILKHTGIAQRRYVDSPVGSSGLGLEAARKALDNAQLSPSDIDLIIFATLSPDYFFPGSGVLLGAELGIPGVPALDVRNQCSGFVYGLQSADAMIRAGIYKRVLLVGAEVQSTGLDFSDEGRSVAVLFGDGAGAVVLGAGPADEGGIIHTILGADGRHADALICRVPSSRRFPAQITAETLASRDQYPQMNGRKVFKNAIRTMRDLCRQILADTGHSLDDISLIIPHQANLRISQLVQESLGVEPERFYNNIDRYGNTTAAALPIALDECRRTGRVDTGDKVLLVAFGSGFTWGAALMEL